MSVMHVLVAPLIVLASIQGDVSRAPSAQSGRAQQVGRGLASIPVIDTAAGRPIECVDPRTGAGSALVTQRMSLTGDLDPLWRPDSANGLAALAALSRQMSAADGRGGSFVAWVDESHGEPNIRLQRYASGGTVLESWPLGGVSACRAAGSQYQLALAAGSEGAFLVWCDFRSGRASLYAQRIGHDGTVLADWPDDGRPVCMAAIDPSNPQIAFNSGGGGAFVVWEDRRAGGLTVVACRLDASGHTSAGWPPEGVALSIGAVSGTAPQITAVSQGRALVVWNETVASGSAVRAMLLGHGRGATCPTDG